MLLEEQAAELLSRCEKLLGLELRQTRGNLRKAGTRAAAVWELLVLEAASHVGSVEYEPHPGGSPDIRLKVLHGRPIWLEAAYLYPRFWDEERRSSAVCNWLFAEAKRRGISRQSISVRLDGIPRKGTGPVRILPKLNERSQFLRHPQLVAFFTAVDLHPGEPVICDLSPSFSVKLSYSPTGSYGSIGGLVQESPTALSEHAVYRSLVAKAKQHKVNGPRVVCIGSDQSPALSTLSGPGTGRPSARQAAEAGLSEHKSLSAAIVVTIRSVPTGFGQLQRQARRDLIVIPSAKEKLTDTEIQSLLSMDFNRWTYTYPLPKWETGEATFQRRMTGTLTRSNTGMSIKIEIPANIVVDALAGKKSLAQAFEIDDNEEPARVFKDGWVVVSCALNEGNPEAGEAPKIVLELVAPPLAAFWTKK